MVRLHKREKANWRNSEYDTISILQQYEHPRRKVGGMKLGSDKHLLGDDFLAHKRVFGDIPEAECSQQDNLSKYGIVGVFTNDMREKLYRKSLAGYTGWANRKCKRGIEIQLQNCIDKQIQEGGQAIDIANLAMMLWYLNKEYDE